MIVTLRDVGKTYGTRLVETQAVVGVDLELVPQDYVAIMGASGSGKSSLATLIGLLDTPTTGTIAIDGRDVSRASDNERAALRRERLGFVFQAFHLIPHLSVLDNVELGLDRSIPRAERKQRAREVLGELGLAARISHLPPQLSGGQQQRVAIARAVARRPQLLICDEPTGNLDTRNGEAVMDILGALNAAGTAILLVTHSETVAERARRRFEMTDGRLTQLTFARVAAA